jgi:serralysin
MASLSFDTAQPSQTIALNGWTVDPIFTVGEKIGDYVAPGILDGLGAFSLNNDTVRIFANHELGPTVGYKYTLQNGTQLTGARVSYFDVDKRTFQIVDAGLAYNKVINRAGNEVKSSALYSATNLNGLDSAGGLARFCSAALFEANQFGAGKGLADRTFFANEESGNNPLGSSQYAIDVATGTMYAVPWFGHAGFENVTEVDTGTTNKVAFVIGDDRSPATGVPLILYVGDKVANSSNFLERNGLSGGKLFVWVADDPKDATDPIEADPRQFNGNNKSLNGKFVEIKHYDATSKGANGYDALGFADQAKQDALSFAGAKAFGFARIEDVATNPKDGTQLAFNATGNSSLFGGQDSWGTTYRIDIDFNNINTGDIVGKVDILNDGNISKDAGVRSPDNLEWATDGKIYINEDPAFSGFAQTTKIPNSIFSLDPSNANPSSTVTRIAYSDRSTAALPATQTDAAPTDLGNWETSGTLDVSKLFGAQPGQILLFDTQAHSLRDGTIITATNQDTDGNGTITAAENLVEGGQLAFLIAPNANLKQNTSTYSGTTGADTVEAGVTKGFDGVNDIVFTGAGKDMVDSLTAGALAGNNRIDTGSDADLIYVANNDRIFGQAGDDIFEASDATGYRISGGAGNDTFYLGTNGRGLGGDGNDKLFVGTGGGNILSGGAGADQFWIANAELPSAANTILDFQIGTDVIGIQGAKSLGISATSLTLTQVGADTSINFGGQTLALLTGIQATSLTPGNASQFVFA